MYLAGMCAVYPVDSVDLPEMLPEVQVVCEQRLAEEPEYQLKWMLRLVEALRGQFQRLECRRG
jgi:hypothetical protein